MKASEFLKGHEKQRQKSKTDDEAPEEEDHSLQAQARKRTRHPQDLHAGTAFDWEDLERYQKELDRLDREGAARSTSTGKKHH